jgi:recombination protein RecR
MAQFPYSIENLIAELSNLPGVGRKTAERYVFYLLKRPKNQLEKLCSAISQLQKQIFICPQCGNFSEQNSLCAICASDKRDRQTLCLVAESHDLIVIESTAEYRGLYHVLGGTINPIDGITEEQLNIRKLLERLKNEKITEVIFALNPDLAGEATTIYLKKLLTPFNVKLTRLARGLPMGADLEYADEITLGSAIKGRRDV